MVVRPERRLSKHFQFMNQGRTLHTHNAGQHLVEHRAETPPVDLVAVRETLDDLWREVLCRSTERARRVV